jgi:hypothetical protein
MWRHPSQRPGRRPPPTWANMFWPLMQVLPSGGTWRSHPGSRTGPARSGSDSSGMTISFLLPQGMEAHCRAQTSRRRRCKRAPSCWNNCGHDRALPLGRRSRWALGLSDAFHVRLPSRSAPRGPGTGRFRFPGVLAGQTVRTMRPGTSRASSRRCASAASARGSSSTRWASRPLARRPRTFSAAGRAAEGLSWR